MSLRTRIVAAAVAALALCALATRVMAQVNAVIPERLRQLEDRKRKDLEADLFLKTPGEGRYLWGVGGWETVTLLDFQDEDRSSALKDLLRSLTVRDTRLWYSGQFGQRYAAYLRVRTQDLSFSTDPSIPKPDFAILQPLDVDMAYVDILPDPAARLRIGRQLLRVGQGIALSEVLDGGSYHYTARGITGQAFYATTPNRLLNVDSSIVGFNHGHTRRDFVGGEVTYAHPSGNRYYVYHTAQVDRSGSESPSQAPRDFHYNSSYTGVGATLRSGRRGSLVGEYIHEEGRTLADVIPDVRIPIVADALDLQYLYAMQGAGNRLITAEYAFGNGDPTRANVTDVFGGKQVATTDHNFLYFGLVDTGLALSPRLSNIHMARLGVQQKLSFRGFTDDRTRPLVGVRFSDYYKEHIAGAISDPLAIGPGAHVGSAWDVFTAWRVLSDLALNVQYGVFNPGNAYPDARQTSGERLLVSSTLSF